MTAISLLADALIEAAADFDGDVADAHISIQLHEDDDFEWWSANIAEGFDGDMTRWLDGDDAARDLALIRDGKADEVAERYASLWDDEWTEFHGESDDEDDEDEDDEDEDDEDDEDDEAA